MNERESERKRHRCAAQRKIRTVIVVETEKDMVIEIEIGKDRQRH